MKRSIFVVLALCVGLALALSLAEQAFSQAKPEEAKPDRISGRVQMINKDTSTITVRENRTNASRQIVYSASTKVTADNKPGTIDDVKEGSRIIALGKFEGVKLNAERIEVRPTK